jgi:hypothetical protein
MAKFQRRYNVKRSMRDFGYEPVEKQLGKLHLWAMPEV